MSNGMHAGGKEDDDTNWPYGTGKPSERSLEGKDYHSAEAGSLISRGFREVMPLESSVGDPQGRDIAAKNIQIKGDHYKKYPIQPYEYNQRNGLRYCEGNVVKYVTRHRDKGGRDDILKAIHYLNLLLEEEYNDGKKDQG